jgi:phosphatidylglycerophosphate synthase
MDLFFLLGFFHNLYCRREMESMTSDIPSQRDAKTTGVIPYIIPSAVSAARVLLAVLIITNVASPPEEILIAAFLGVPIVFILDAVDGILARRLNSQTLLGSFIDIAADRLVEFIFLQHFIRVGLVPLWFVLIFYCRIVLTDACRMRAFRLERVSATGILLSYPWRSFVLSKFSRSAYAGLKAALFSVLLLAMHRGDASRSLLESGILLSVLAFSLLRAMPILITYFPRRIRLLNVEEKPGPLKNHGVTRKSRVASWVQLAYDICLATALVLLAWH